MIVTNLYGGLGNQLFQYAAGLAAAKRSKSELGICIDMFNGYQVHQGYELARTFDVKPRVLPVEELSTYLGLWRGVISRKILGRLAPGFTFSKKAAFQPRGGYWCEFEDIGNDIYIQGYWQSEKYFQSEASAVREALVFRKQVSVINEYWIQRIKSCVSIGMHVRRGDYLGSKKNQRLYAQCTPEYYRAATQLILAREPKAQFFAFSDDPDWTRDIFADYPIKVEVLDHNRGGESFNDLRLMSLCRHNIIANSTFSWWAAWLAERTDKIVIAPKRWFLPPGLDKDLIPKRWTRL